MTISKDLTDLLAALPRPLRIGTRGSKLALIQAEEVLHRLAALSPSLAAPGALALVPVATTGDKVKERPLAEIGGKGLFVKELEEALAKGVVDLAVHSMKDVPAPLPSGFAIGCFLPREDPRDVLVMRRGDSLRDLTAGARIGTSAPRRQAQILNLRPDLDVIPFRGNVDTRLRKLRAGEADATILALAGLKRLGLEDVGAVLTTETMLPASGQGAIGVEVRETDMALREILSLLDHEPTAVCVRAERAVIEALGGSCRTPVGAWARIDASGNIVLDALVATLDGKRLWRAAKQGAIAEDVRLGRDAGSELRRLAGTAIDWEA
ncbi:MAG: hydroxymethylbilane synthase [Alphaproteobacteria bacterium]